MNKEEILKKLQEAVVNGDIDAAAFAAKEAAETGLDPLYAIENGLAKGVKIVGDGFGRGELFLMDLMSAAEAMKTGLEILKPLISHKEKRAQTLGTFLIGTVSGDIHDIGKTIVASMLTANGFEVIDLGADVPNDVFIEKVREIQPDILGLSALMTTTMFPQKAVIYSLKEVGLRDKVKVMIGGAVVTEEWSEEIGADAWSKDALDAVEKAKKLVKT